MLRVFLGHHKCASQWMSDIFRELCDQAGLCYAKCTDGQNLGKKLAHLPIKSEPCMLFYTNADYRMLTRLPDFLGIHLIRDPRDVCISAYYSHMHSHPTRSWPELTKHRNNLASLNFEDGLLLDMEFCKKYLTYMGTWNFADPRILELRFEEVTVNPLQYFRKIITYLELEHLFSQETLTTVVEKNSYRQKSKGRQRGELNIHSHYRSGLSDQWKVLFTQNHIELFKRHYGWILKNTGYGA